MDGGAGGGVGGLAAAATLASPVKWLVGRELIVVVSCSKCTMPLVRWIHSNVRLMPLDFRLTFGWIWTFKWWRVCVISDIVGSDCVSAPAGCVSMTVCCKLGSDPAKYECFSGL